MSRLMLCDEHWSKQRPIMYQQCIYDKKNLRLTVEGFLYRMRTGCPWLDLPADFGHRNSVYKPFNEWSIKGKYMNLCQAPVEDPDLEWEFIDGSRHINDEVKHQAVRIHSVSLLRIDELLQATHFTAYQNIDCVGWWRKEPLPFVFAEIFEQRKNNYATD